MKKIKILTLILLIVLVTMVGFFGVYSQVQNRMENGVKDYSYTMNLKGAREVRLKADTTTNEVLTVENYKKVKEILDKRLKKLNVQDYIIRLDETSGDIVIELTENDETDTIVSNIDMVGKFEIIDSETSEVLIDNSDIKLANVLSNTSSSGTSIYLNIEFNKEGTKKLENITNTYVKSSTTDAENTESDESTTEDTTNDKKITMKIDDEEIMSTSFEEPIKDGKIQLSIGSASTDKNTIKDYNEKGQTIATILDTGKLPIKYTTDENKYVVSDITKEDLKTVEIIVALVTAIALILLIVKYKRNGVLASISYIGLASALLLIIRYANVYLSIEGIFGVILTLVLNYILTFKLLSNIKEDVEINKVINTTVGKFFVEIIPVCILTIAFCFMQWIPISSFGMVMFWGLVIIAVYNIVITKNLLKIGEEK